ncbi:DEKNAAC102256 [Brettanomyces naardenensis]|uniref:DEKNAAC102256 n=1 Tax=Brettanomyces naardenensis TaxID=13370 RepID=A0A448YL11_BRENA|nr:DEKNAAC102256 [Brettanomyces naardenensis]
MTSLNIPNSFLDFEEEFFRDRSYSQTCLTSDYYSELDPPFVHRDSISSGYSSVSESTGSPIFREIASPSAMFKDVGNHSPMFKEGAGFTGRQRTSSVNSTKSLTSIGFQKSLNKFTQKLRTKSINQSPATSRKYIASSVQGEYSSYPHDQADISTTFSRNVSISSGNSIFFFGSHKSESAATNGTATTTPPLITAPTFSRQNSFASSVGDVSTRAVPVDVSDEYFSKQGKRYHAFNLTSFHSMKDSSSSLEGPEFACSEISSLGHGSIRALCTLPAKIHSEGWILKDGVLLESGDVAEEKNEDEDEDEEDLDSKQRRRQREEAIADLVAEDVLKRLTLD